MLAQVEKIWIYLDDNEDTYLSFEELMLYLQFSFGEEFTDDDALALFKLIATGNKCLIVKKEMIKFFEKLFLYNQVAF